MGYFVIEPQIPNTAPNIPHPPSTGSSPLLSFTRAVQIYRSPCLQLPSPELVTIYLECKLIRACRQLSQSSTREEGSPSWGSVAPVSVVRESASTKLDLLLLSNSPSAPVARVPSLAHPSFLTLPQPRCPRHAFKHKRLLTYLYSPIFEIISASSQLRNLW